MKTIQNRPNLYYLIIKTSSPIILSFLVSYIQIFTDQSFLGHYKTNVLVAINNAAFPYFIVANVSFAIGNALAIIIAQHIGSGNRLKAKRLMETSYLCNLGLTIPFFLLFLIKGGDVLTALGSTGDIHTYATEYLTILAFNLLFLSISVSTSSAFQGIGNNVPNLIGEIVRVALNVALNWLLIFGKWGFPEMGIRGAALATVISTFIGAMVSTALLFSYKTELPLSVKKCFTPVVSKYKEVFKLGAPMIAEYTVNHFIPLIIIFFLNQKESLYAGVYGIWNTLILFSFFISMGIGITSFSLTAQAIGAKDWRRARKTTYGIINYALFWTVIVGMAYMLFPRPILSLFSKDQDLITSASSLGLLVALLFPRAIGMISSYTLKCYGKSLIVFIGQLTGLITIPLCLYIFLIKLDFGVSGALLALLIDECIKGIINFTLMEKLSQKKMKE